MDAIGDRISAAQKRLEDARRAADRHNAQLQVARDKKAELEQKLSAFGCSTLEEGQAKLAQLRDKITTKLDELEEGLHRD